MNQEQKYIKLPFANITDNFSCDTMNVVCNIVYFVRFCHEYLDKKCIYIDLLEQLETFLTEDLIKYKNIHLNTEYHQDNYLYKMTTVITIANICRNDGEPHKKYIGKKRVNLDFSCVQCRKINDNYNNDF
jgi:hypothetical protein